MNRHYETDELLAYLDDNSDVVDLNDLRLHLAECPICEDKVNELRQWSSLLSDGSLWEDLENDAAVSVGDAEQGDLLATLEERIATEDSAAESFLDELPLGDYAAWETSIEQRAEMRTPGLVRSLIKKARGCYNRAPAEALPLLDIAMRILAATAPRAMHLEGDIWKERANAFRLLGRIAFALAALDAAEGCYRAFPSSSYDCAFVYWSRATAYFETKRFADARLWSRRAAEIFESYRDHARLAQVQILDASILFDEGNLCEARSAFLAIEPLLIQLNDDETLARVYANLSGCEIRLGELAEARDHEAKAVEMYDRLDMPTEAVRLYWSLGESLKLLGRPDEALAVLRVAAKRFKVLDMEGAAASVGLDTADVLNALGDFEEAADICARLISYFQQEGADVDSVHAIHFLREAIMEAEASSGLFAYVRGYLVARQLGSEDHFIPPLQPN